MNQKDPLRQFQGKINKARGQNFEEYIDRSFDWYELKGLAIVDKAHEPMRVIKPLGQGKFIAHFAKHDKPDYKGMVRGGKTVIIEAKYTSKDRIEQSRVNDGQADYMTKHHRLGALCYVVVGFGSGGVYRIPWLIWLNMKEHFGRKYVREDELEDYKVSAGSNGLLRLLE